MVINERKIKIFPFISGQKHDFCILCVYYEKKIITH